MCDEKYSQRKSFKKIRNELRFRDEKNCKITKKVLQLFKKLDCRTIFSYVSIGSEVDTCALLKELLPSKIIFVPHTANGRMKLFRLTSADSLQNADKVGNVFSDLEITAKDAYSGIPSITIVPMLAFTKQLFRLGYGGGYYDKFLINNPTVKIGLAYDEQEASELFIEEHDVQLDYIITPTRVIRR